jgi:hypothetical protein
MILGSSEGETIHFLRESRRGGVDLGMKRGWGAKQANCANGKNTRQTVNSRLSSRKSLIDP